jgi:penicillin-binding protein 2
MKSDNDFFIVENINIKRNSSPDWVENSFNSFEDKGESGSAQFLSLSLSTKKLKFFLLFLLFGVMVLFGKSFYLQVIKGEHYFALAEDNRIRTKYIKASRGVFYDRNSNPLVHNISGFSIFITPADLPRNDLERDMVLQHVSDIAEISLDELKEKINDRRYYFQPIAIETGIGYERAMALKIISADLLGVSLEIDTWRQYLAGSSFSHLLGYVGKINAEEYESKSDNYLLSDNIGKTGLEKSFEDLLRGEHGKRLIEVDAFGREKKVVSRSEFRPGRDLILSIDQELQNKSYEILEEALGDKKAAVVIISNPQNGEILSLVDYPSYDNNLFATGISHDDYNALIGDERNPLFMRSIAGEYPSGSTVKIVVSAAALEEGLVTRNTTFTSVGGLWVGNKWFFPDWKTGGHGLTNVTKAIAESVNTYFYYIGGGFGEFTGLGVDVLGKYMRMFGIGERLGIDLPGEQDGFVPTKDWKEEVKNEPWYIGDTYHLAIGQGDILVTPLQVNSYTAAIANGGTLYRPMLVRELIHDDGKREILMPEIIRDIEVDSGNIDIVRSGMRQAVTGGSAIRLNSLPVEAAGKTGTAQWNSTKENHAWFTAFAPYDKPSFAITVLVEEGGEGSAVAVPIANEIMRYWFGR